MVCLFCLYQMNTLVQLILVAASLAAPVFNYVDSMYLQTLWYVTLMILTTKANSFVRKQAVRNVLNA